MKRMLFLWVVSTTSLLGYISWNAPSSASAGTSYYVEATDWDADDVWLWKNGGYFASGYGSAGSYTSDGSPGWVYFEAESYSYYYGNDYSNHSVEITSSSNQTPNAAISVDGHTHGATVTRPLGSSVTVTVRYSATDSDGNLSGIRYNIWHPGTGYFNNGGGGFVSQSGSSGEVVQTVVIASNGDWYFWTDAQDSASAYASTGHWEQGFRISVQEGGNTPPSVSISPSGVQGITVGQSLTYSSVATDVNSNMTAHNFDWRDPDGAWAWEGGWGLSTNVNRESSFGSSGSSSRSINVVTSRTGTFRIRWSAYDPISGWAVTTEYDLMSSAAPDTTPPSTPINLRTTDRTDTSFMFHWDASSDSHSGVKHYEILKDGAYYGTTTATNLSINGLSPAVVYSMQVRAQDHANNFSNWSAPSYTATTHSATGDTPSSIWLDVNGDGIRDEVIKAGSEDFTFFINSWSTECYDFSWYPINEFFFDWGFDWGSSWSDTPGFSRLWYPDLFWHYDSSYSYCETYLEPTIAMRTEAGYEYRLYEDISGSVSYNASNWYQHFSSAAFGDAHTLYSLGWWNADSFYMNQLFFTRIGKPLGGATLSFTGGDLVELAPNANLTVNLVPGGSIVVRAKDLLGRILRSGPSVSWEIVKNGITIQPPTVADFIDLALHGTGNFNIGVRLDNNASPMWFSVAVAATPPPPQIELIVHQHASAAGRVIAPLSNPQGQRIGAVVGRNLTFKASDSSLPPAQYQWTGSASGDGPSIQLAITSPGDYYQQLSVGGGQPLVANVKSVLIDGMSEGIFLALWLERIPALMEIRTEVMNWAVSLGGGQRNTRADAARHAYLFARITVAYSESFAYGLAKAHEVTNLQEQGWANEGAMDMLNNEAGFQIGVANPGANNDTLRNQVLARLTSGQLWIMDDTRNSNGESFLIPSQ